MTDKNLRLAKKLVLLNAFVPAALLAWDAWHHRLGANPVNFAILTTGMLALIFLLHENQHFIRVGGGDVAHRLNFRIADALRAQSRAQLVYVRGLGETNIHVRAALEVDAVTKSAMQKDRGPAGHEQNGAKGLEILGFAHPVDVGFFK